MTKAVVELLKEYGRANYRSDGQELPKHVADLISANPFAFLIGAVFDRGIAWRRAWEIPYHIAQRRMLDPSKLASATDHELRTLIRNLPVKPRYPNQGVRTLRETARLVNEFGGDASGIWKETSPSVAQKRLQRIHGVGHGIAAMATKILYDEHGFFRGQEHELDIKPDVHVMRVFMRTGLISTEDEHLAVNAARRLVPHFPGEIDWPSWDIGQRWCHKTRPACIDCPLTDVCPKRI